MLKIPHASFHFRPSAVLREGVREAFLAVEPAVPGCTVYVSQQGYGVTVLRKVNNLADVPPTKLFVVVPYHATRCFSEWLNGSATPAVRAAVLIEGGKAMRHDHGPRLRVIDTEALLAAGRTTLPATVNCERFHDYQFAPVHAVRAGYRFFLIRSDGGSGKSPMALAAAVEAGCRRILCLILGATRNPHTGWPAMSARWVNRRYYIGLPKSDPAAARQPNPDLMQMGSGIAFIAVESVADYMNVLRLWKPDGIIIDEIHKHGNPKRVKAVINVATGDRDWQGLTTAAKGNDTRAKCLSDLSNLSSVKFILALTATHFSDGQPEHLWAPLDLLQPWGWGTNFNFKQRYQNGPYMADNGDPGFEKRSPSHVVELKQRLGYCVLDIPSAVTKPHIKRCEVIFTRVPVEAQGTDRGFGFSQAVKALTKSGEATSLHELRLAQDSARLWPYIQATLAERVAAGHRCVVFGTRNEVLEKWAERAAKQWPSAWVGCIHGEVAKADDILGAYANGIPFSQPAILFANRLMFGTGTNGLEETHWACDASPSTNPATLIQLMYRFERPKPRLDASTILEELICVGGYNEQRLVKLEENLLAASKLTDSGDVAGLLIKAGNAAFDGDVSSPEAQSNMADNFLASIGAGLDDY